MIHIRTKIRKVSIFITHKPQKTQNFQNSIISPKLIENFKMCMKHVSYPIVLCVKVSNILISY